MTAFKGMKAGYCLTCMDKQNCRWSKVLKRWICTRCGETNIRPD